MATNSSAATLNVSYCKKCAVDHERPVGNKCDKKIVPREEKRDASKDNMKKTPKSKGSVEPSEKMYEMMMSTMSSFTDKLSAMENRISGLASQFDDPNLTQRSTGRKSRSHSKRRKTDEDDINTLTSPVRDLVQAQDGSLFQKTFPDTAVMIKIPDTPAKLKKQKSDNDLGVTPLIHDIPATKFVPVATPVRPTFTTAGHGFENNTFISRVPAPVPGIKKSVCDYNQNILTDQYGNAVQIQAPVDQAQSTIANEVPVVEQPSVLTLESLRSNPLVQRLVDERVAFLETKMKLELAQGTPTRKKSGRYNLSETPNPTPHLRWPNESCLIGTARKRTAYDELTFGQFVVGFIQNIMDVNHTETANRMLVELMEVAKLSENLSWTIARGAFAASMHKIEEGQLSWQDTRVLSDNRLTYSQAAVFSGSTTMSPRATHSPQIATNAKKVVCKWFNEGTCPHNQDHTDSTGTTQFRHICMFCFKFLKRSNGHTETDCLNKKKPVTID